MLNLKKSTTIEEVIAQMKKEKKDDAISEMADKIISLIAGNVKLMGENAELKKQIKGQATKDCDINIKKVFLADKDGLDFNVDKLKRIGKINALTVSGTYYNYISIMKSKYDKSQFKINGVPVNILEGGQKVKDAVKAGTANDPVYINMYTLNDTQKIQICDLVSAMIKDAAVADKANA